MRQPEVARVVRRQTRFFGHFQNAWMVDVNRLDFHARQQFERGNEFVPVCRMAAYLRQADVRQLEAQQGRGDQHGPLEEIDDRLPIRFAE